MKTKKEVIKGVLEDFLGIESEIDTNYEDVFIGLVLDEDEIEILATAISEALEKRK